MSDKKPTYQELEHQIIALKEVQIDAITDKDEQYKMLFDSMTGMVSIIELIYDKHGQPIDFYIRDINQSNATFFGKPKDQLINTKATAIIPTIEAHWLTAFASVDKTGLPNSFENYGIEFDKYYLVNAWKFSKNRVCLSFTDITEQKRKDEDKFAAELKLQEIKNELAEVQKLANIGSWLHNPTNQKVECSDEIFHIWGFDPKEGTPEYDAFVKRIHPDDLELHISSVTKASNLGTPYDIEFRICIPNGEQKTLRAICQTVLGDSNKVMSLRGTNQDITKQKLYEEAIIKHERLKAIAEMSSSIAHDFNNSLQGMMGNLEIAKLQNDLSETTLDRLNSVESTITDVVSRVNALQHFGDPERESKNAELINLNTLIAESLKQSRPLWKDHIEKEGLKINVTTDFGDIPKINCDKGELKTALHNLIKNSIEAMPKGGDLSFKTGLKTEGVFVTFTDTGAGMDDETKLKVFQPFYTTKGFTLGRGLGMTGVYSIVKKYKGDIFVKSSELGKGTTIEIVFPIGQQEDIKDIPENQPEPKDKAAFRVLWVDDDTTIRENASELLAFIGHNCDHVNSGKHALDYLNNNTCDIVFTDIGMPEMNGWELADAIRKTFGNTIKIVAVTGWDIDEKTKNDHHIDFVLQKPFTIEALEKIITVV